MHDDTIQAAVAETMAGINEFVRLLDRDDIPLILNHLKDEIDHEIALTGEVAGRRRELMARISHEADCNSLRGIHEELNGLELERFLKIQSVGALHESCTQYRDILAGRALELVEQEMLATGKGDPPVPYSLCSMGSDGREEQTLITDQDYLIVYGDGGGEIADQWFKEFSEALVECLADMGFKKCTGGIMPSNPTWRGSYSQWKKKLMAIVRYEYEDYAKNLMDLIVLSDARHVGGDRRLAGDLVELIRGLEKDYFQVLWGMAKAATEMKLALGFLNRIWTEGSGDHKGEFNLKLLAWAPLVMNVRILAINQGIPATNTIRRIELLQNEGSFSATFAQGLVDAYTILTRHRILLQIKVIKGIQDSSYYLNPYTLPTDEREKIRQALIRIEDLQRTIHTNFSIM
ncbi:putative nucleotidyltransferase substrate binding domain-containing protein [Geobacter benzoatilyticus]|uniref:Nucleotidyltransferase n=1 Tax=Geobacter benzoatilyticus TaxID=2815309 RepID=A0ABX7PZS0_9BACT|nr:putative nucleotidyltransferase substrate binding domain-containing protein [Geobacter benzoatilyticus]QSV44376.1 nucleotidyltransferase [Geobacter benzoatilyticus]